MTDDMASSVAEPEVPQEAGANGTNGLKRRQSDVSEQESKRQRTSPGKSSPTATEEPAATNKDSDNTAKSPQNATTDTREPRRKSGAEDEKQRSKRLFGALLGNLNRPPSDRVSKRRSEIEQRRKAELQKQDDERLEDRQRRLEILAVQRKREQIKIDEENMRVRHENMLNAANFLQTKAEPKLYYRPWDLLSDEEDRIDDQIRDAKAQIEDEVAEFKIEKRRRLEELGDTYEDDSASAPSAEDPAPEGEAPDSAAPSKTQEAEEPHADAEPQAPAEPTNKSDTQTQQLVPESEHGDDHVDGAGKKEDAADPSKEEVAEEHDATDPNDAKKAEEPIIEQPPAEQREEVEESDQVLVGDEDTVEY